MKSVYTVREVADMVRVHPKTVYLWIHSGHLGALLVGPRTVRIPLSEVEKLMKRTNVGSGDES